MLMKIKQIELGNNVAAVDRVYGTITMGATSSIATVTPAPLVLENNALVIDPSNCYDFAVATGGSGSGLITISLADNPLHFITAIVSVAFPSGTNTVSAVQLPYVPTTYNADRTIDVIGHVPVQFVTTSSGAAVDPPSGTQINFELVMTKSNALKIG
jgi:hypothetical protein